MCVCVCVCEREREEGGEVFDGWVARVDSAACRRRKVLLGMQPRALCKVIPVILHGVVSPDCQKLEGTGTLDTVLTFFPESKGHPLSYLYRIRVSVVSVPNSPPLSRRLGRARRLCCLTSPHGLYQNNPEDPAVGNTGSNRL